MAKEEKEVYDSDTGVLQVQAVNFETAYQQKDYPYGSKLRCIRAIWIETNPRHGMRFVHRTTNPKKRVESWNTPHVTTYSDVIALYVDAKGYAYTDRLDNIAWVSRESIEAWGKRNQALIEANPYVKAKYDQGLAARIAYDEAKKLKEAAAQLVPAS